MALTFNEKVMRKDLIKLYKDFIEKPEDETVRGNLMQCHLDWGGLVVYNDYLKSQPIPLYIVKALGSLIDMVVYGQGFRFESKEECISFAKEILRKLEEKDNSAE